MKKVNFTVSEKSVFSRYGVMVLAFFALMFTSAVNVSAQSYIGSEEAKLLVVSEIKNADAIDLAMKTGNADDVKMAEGKKAFLGYVHRHLNQGNSVESALDFAKNAMLNNASSVFATRKIPFDLSKNQVLQIREDVGQMLEQ